MKKRLRLLLFALLLLLVTGCDRTEPERFRVAYLYSNNEEVIAHRAHMEGLYDFPNLDIVSIPFLAHADATSKDKMIEKIDNGYDLIVVISFEYRDYVEEVAEEYPNVIFLYTGGHKTSDNRGDYFGEMVNAKYVAGAVSAQAYKRMHPTETVKIGYVATFAYPDVIKGIDAFTLGAQSIDPDATTEVKWTDSTFDSVKETALANDLIANGANILTQHLDSTTTQAVAEANEGVYAVGYVDALPIDSSTPTEANEGESNIISSIWSWGPYTRKRIEAIHQGTWTADGFYGYNDQKEMVKLNPKTTDATDQQLVDDIFINIFNGFNIFSGDNLHGPIYDNNEVMKVDVGEELDDSEIKILDWFVKGVISGNYKKYSNK